MQEGISNFKYQRQIIIILRMEKSMIDNPSGDNQEQTYFD